MDLFGRKKYEEHFRDLELQISELSKEKEALASQLEKRDEKIKKLTSAYQEANISLKAAEKKASSPLMEPSRPKQERATGRTVQVARLKPKETKKLLKRLGAISSPESDLLTAYLKDPQSLPVEAKGLAEVVSSNRGMAVLHCPQIFTLALEPPFPVRESPPALGSAFQLDQLEEFLDTPALVVSAHAGDTFIGLSLTKDDFEIQEIVESPVKEKHSKGGWSQKRFERLREEDIRNHVEEVIEKLSEISGKYRPIAKYAVVCGDPVLLKMILPALGLQVVERRIERHDSKRLDRMLDEVYAFTCYKV